MQKNVIEIFLAVNEILGQNNQLMRPGLIQRRDQIEKVRYKMYQGEE